MWSIKNTWMIVLLYSSYVYTKARVMRYCIRDNRTMYMDKVS